MALKVPEIARILDLPEATILRWVRQGRIPVLSSTPEPVFSREEITRWATELHMPVFPLEGQGNNRGTKSPSLADALRRGGVHRDVNATSVEDALRRVSDLAPISAEHRKFLFEQLLQREELSSTGIGRRVAVPHPRRPLQGIIEEPVMLCAFLADELDYGAIDREPVRVLMLLLSPSTRVHLVLLSRLAFCLRDPGFHSILQPSTPDDVLLETIRETESRLEAGSVSGD